MDKLDPHLKSLYIDWQEIYHPEKRPSEKDPYEKGLLEEGGPADEPSDVSPDVPIDADVPEPGQRIEVFLMFQDDLEPIKSLGFAPRTVKGHLATGTLSLDDIDAISAHPNVIKIKLARILAPELDESIRDINAHVVRQVRADGSGWDGIATGQGVIVGVIDTGINYKHKSFRNPDKSTRILAIWDQQDDDTGPHPEDYGQADNLFAGYTYGSVFDKEAIDNALREENPIPIPHEDKSGHGAHVAGIAAGNGSQDDRCIDPFTYAGVAPEADLVIVKFSGTEGEKELGNDVRLVDAIEFINQLADHEDKPAVINISMGDNLGPHDGTSFVELMIDLIYDAAEGRALVKSAGNEGNKNRHAEDTVLGNSQIDIPFTVEPDDRRTRWLNVWYSEAASLDCVIVPPAGPPTSPEVSPGDTDNFTVQGGGRVRIISEEGLSGVEDNNILVRLRRPPNGHHQSGTWKIRLINDGADDVPFHAWLERHLSRTDDPPFFINPTHEMTLSIPGTAHHAIVVANYITKGDDDDIGKRSGSSSLGPTRDSRPDEEQKPDLAAPGTVIMSARASPLGYCEACLSNCCQELQFYTKKPGTSMAAPHVAGAIALMLEKNPDLTSNEILSILRESARTDGFTSTILPGDPSDDPPNIAWGAGKLDVDEAVEQAIIFDGLPLPEPDPESSPTPEPTPVDPITVSPPQGTPRPAPVLIDLDALEEKFLSTQIGRHYAALVEKHIDEVMRLINTNKRVATVWHRNGGPMIVRAVLRSLAYHDEPLPEVVNGISLQDRLTPFINIVRRYASQDLIIDIDQHEALLWQFQGKSIDQLEAVLSTGLTGIDSQYIHDSVKVF